MNKKRLGIIIGIVVAAVIIAVVLDTVLANHRPAIGAMEAPQRVDPQGRCQIVCTASDRDGDALSYNWSATGGNISGTGGAVNWTAPREAGSYNVTVTVTDGHGGAVTDGVTVTVRRNDSPVIRSLAATSTWTLRSGSLNVTCDASDSDRDELTYEWTASGGDISGTGAAVSWAAPQEVGIYNITVVVSDGYDASDRRTVPLSVVTGEPPSIEALVISAEHCYLKTNTSPSMVGKEQMYDIECVVSDMDAQLSYDWSCDAGAISGEGSMINWTAPNTKGNVTITVIVSDIAGNMVGETLVLKVVDCSRCTFDC